MGLRFLENVPWQSQINADNFLLRDHYENPNLIEYESSTKNKKTQHLNLLGTTEIYSRRRPQYVLLPAVHGAKTRVGIMFV